MCTDACVTVDYQQIGNDNIANQIHGFTIDYGKFILIRNILRNIIKEWEYSPLSGEQQNTEYLKLKYSSSTPDLDRKC